MRLNEQFVICAVLLIAAMGTGVVKALAEEKTGAAPGKAHGLMNLRKPDKPRFPVTDIVWPAHPGEADICLWEDDKLAAFSYGADDNCAPNVPWWLEQTKIYNIHMTWFLVTENVNVNAMAGSWKLWQQALEAGHGIESHTVKHWVGFKGDSPPEGWKGMDWEYSESIKQIEAGLPGHEVRCLAYAGGAPQKRNDPNLAAKYYLAARGGYPSPNAANNIDYMNVQASGGPYTRPVGENPKIDFSNFNHVLIPHDLTYRGWVFGFSHWVGNPDQKKGVLVTFDWYKEHAEQLWCGLFCDVARYGQERDTAKLVVDENNGSRIAFTLTDQMDDRFYDYPLTIKVRLPGNSKGVKAVQQTKEVPVRIVEKDGGKFALVKAVPDRGQVVMTPTR